MCRCANCLILLLFCAGCDSLAKAPAAGGPPELPEVVIVAAPEKREIENVVECAGRMEASESVTIHAPVAGMLLSVATYTSDQSKDFRAGDNVRQGDLLLVIATRPEFYSKWIAAEALKLRAKQRLQELADKETSSGRKREAGETPPVTNATAALRASEAELEQLKPQLECVEVRAPIMGVIGNRQVATGSVVRGDGASRLTTIDALQPMHVHFELAEGDLLALLRGSAAAKQRTWNQDVAIGLADEPDFSLQGKVDFVDNQIDPSTGMAQVRAVVSNTTGLLYPGMSVRIKIALSEPRSTLLVRSDAIEEDSQGSYVWLVSKEDQLEKRYVPAGDTVDGLRVVAKLGARGKADSLTADDRYVLNVSPALRAGRRVQVRTDEPSTELAGEVTGTP